MAGEILLSSGGSGGRMEDVLILQLSAAAVPSRQVLEGSGHYLNECEPEPEVDIELLALIREVSLN